MMKRSSYSKKKFLLVSAFFFVVVAIGFLVEQIQVLKFVNPPTQMIYNGVNEYAIPNNNINSNIINNQMKNESTNNNSDNDENNKKRGNNSSNNNGSSFAFQNGKIIKTDDLEKTPNEGDLDPVDSDGIGHSNSNNNNNNNNEDDQDNTKPSEDPCLEDHLILTEECMQHHANQIARPFPYKPKDQWCVPTPERGTLSKIVGTKNQWQGLLYVKVPKVGSSTLAGIALRIHNHTGCEASWEHIEASNFRNHTHQSFLLGSARKPASRDISHIQFFNFGGGYADQNIVNGTPTVQQFLNHGIYYNGHHSMNLLKGQGGYQYQWLTLDKVPKHMVWSSKSKQQPNDEETKVQNPQNVHKKLQHLFEEYDFFVLNERLDESMVVLALLMGIDISTTLAASSAKLSGSYSVMYRTKKKSKRGTCVYRRKFPIPEELYHFLESPKYLAMTYADQLLHRATNRSLDLTIQETIGEDIFDQHLQKYRYLSQKATEYCGMRLGGGCYPNGTKYLPEEPCYVADFLCGYQCLDEAVELVDREQTKQHAGPGNI